MKIFNFLPDHQLDDYTAATIGVFDGLHLGHCALIEKMEEIAREKKLKRAVLTFQDNPKKVTNPDTSKLSNYSLLDVNQKIKMLENRVDYLFLLDFNAVFQLAADEFIRKILIGILNVKHIITGYDFRFGKDKLGKFENLNYFFNNEVTVVKPVEVEGEIISTSLIKKYLMENNFEKANKLLGYNFCFNGIVREGKRLGRKFGFPTANIAYPSGLPELSGIFASVIRINNIDYNAVSHIGAVPTFENSEKIIETYIFDFERDIYGLEIAIFPKLFIRPIIKFNSIDELKKQIIIDVKNVKDLV